MSTRLNPYLSFGDTARQALEFYRDVLGGELHVTTFEEFGMTDGGVGNLIMHAQLETEAGYTIMGADTPPGMERSAGSSITVALTGDDAEQLRGYWAGLSEGANVITPLEKQMWGDEYGMFIDKFGVPWMFNIAVPADPEATPTDTP
ncbi:MAG: VOC family protein [Kineosporiaceae bacterium]|nr:VOC family protein [Kineosporiaceae bacterium]MBK7622518.1 VOC family protein [Kineosporiaceae bacterium]